MDEWMREDRDDRQRQVGCACVTVQSCGESVIASAARQSRWRWGVLWGRRCCYGVEIATAQAPRNDNPLKSEQLPACGCLTCRWPGRCGRLRE